ncbi:MAG: glycosyltransferase [Chitinivibrionales bacterium]|nr:glycosyltransferase [Chitinivibrionales bacterium]
MTKILYIGAAHFIGGAERVLLNFLSHVHPATINARVIIFGKTGAMSDALAKQQVKSLCVQHINFFTGSVWFRVPIIPFQYLWRLVKIFRYAIKYKPDIIHAWCLPAIDVSALLSILLRRPALATLHMSLTVRHVPEIRRLSIKISSAKITSFICVSEATKRAAIDGGVAEQKSITIHNGLPEPAPAFQKSTPLNEISKDRRKIRLSCIGVIQERKGQHVLLQAVHRLKKNGINNWELKIVGDVFRGIGTDYKKNLLAYVNSHNLSASVIFKGWSRDINSVYAHTDILVLPSIDFDPFPTVLLEATQIGIPAIAGTIGGIPEIIIDGDNGWLFPPGNVDALSHILADALEGKLTLSRNTPFRFTLDRQVKETLAIYSKLRGKH